MKKQAYTIIAAIVLFGCLAVAAQGQCTSGSHTSANIPFAFSIGEKTMPAGDYTVACSSQSMLLIQSVDGKAAAFLSMVPAVAKSEGRARLVFHRYGDQYFMAQAWTGGTMEGLELPKTRAERAVEREFIAIRPTQAEIALGKRR